MSTHVMQIFERVVNDVINNCLSMPIETGGILGGKNNVITEFEFDKGTAFSSINHYYPSVEKLDDCINNWQNDCIQFYGIVHSHLQEKRALSFGDKQYIQTIMSAMPTHIGFLYFPVVLPRKEIVSFKAMRSKNEIHIISTDIKIINERMKNHEES